MNFKMPSINRGLVSLFLGIGLLAGSASVPALNQKQAFSTTVSSHGIKMADLSIAGAQNESSASLVTYFNNKKVATAFLKGEALFDGLGERNYRVSASRHDVPSSPEIHVLDTDIDYVLDGTATYITGGTVVDSKTVAPNEIRGTAIINGETFQLSKGDVIIVPHGVPHWFKQVGAPFLYFQVKVR